jgi:hypothetical protein
VDEERQRIILNELDKAIEALDTLSLTKEERDRIAIDLRNLGDRLDARLGAKVADALESIERLAEARSEAGDPKSADELRRMAARLAEIVSGGRRDAPDQFQ